VALAKPSQAEVVYTPTNQLIKPFATLDLDLNNDGVTDFVIQNVYAVCIETSERKECSSFINQVLRVQPTAENGVAAASHWTPPLPPNQKVGPEGKFNGLSAAMESCNTSLGRGPYSAGPWRFKKDRYLGLEISIDGQTHYGWARLSVSLNKKPCKIGAILTGYAYETVAGKPILTGATSDNTNASSEGRPNSTLGTLAIGSARLEASRPEDEH
jgi:hypothetical protein